MIHSTQLEKIKNLRHGFITRKSQSSDRIDFGGFVSFPKQVHGDTINWIRSKPFREKEADAIATEERTLPIGVRVADCAPILLCAVDKNQKARAIMAVHAGWRGTAKNIAGKSLHSLVEQAEIQTEISGVHACIGPCISFKVFEVGKEVAQHFSPSCLKLLGKKKYLFNLERENKEQLQTAAKQLDIPLEVDCLGACTYSNPTEFPSYRRDGPGQERILAFISMLG